MSHQPLPIGGTSPTSESTGNPPKKRRKANDSANIRTSSKGKQNQKEEFTGHVEVGISAVPSTLATLPLPSDTTITNIRSRRTIVHCPDGPPSNLKYLKIFHPANDFLFLRLPACDQLQLQFGVHYETVITACMIVACNRPGYLSKSRSHNVDRVHMPLDSVLLPDNYYYHVDDISKTGELYPICDDFRNWSFPHAKIPPSWAAEPSATLDLPTNWSLLSERIKIRDTACLISAHTQALTTAHIINKEDDAWLQENKMNYYLLDWPLHQSQRNLFCLRYDLCLPLFDRGCFVIVPKSGHLVVHFLRNSAEYLNQFHNVVFDHNHNLSHEALYARFAWALMKIVKELQLDPKKFKILGSKGRCSKLGKSGDGSPSRMGHEDGGGNGDDEEDNVEGEDGNNGDEDGDNVEGGGSDSDDGGDSRNYKPPHSAIRCQRNPDALALQPDSWLYDVLHKMAPGDKQSLEVDECEIKNDLTSAAHDHPFLVDSSIQPTAYNYENIVWYPGMQVVKRRKQAYLNSHPNIMACSDGH